MRYANQLEQRISRIGADEIGGKTSGEFQARALAQRRREITMRIRKQSLLRCTSGQSLVETALMLPLLLMLILNAVNFGYFFLVALNLAAAPRSGVEYSVMGSQTPGTLTLPAASAINDITIADMTGALHSSSNTPVQVCSKLQGVTNPGTATQTANCSTFGNTYSSPPSPASDPESPSFVLQRVDVKYTFNTLIPGTVFNLVLLPVSICTAGGSCTFHRQVSMRVID